MRHLLAAGALLFGIHQAASAQIMIGQTADFSGGLSGAVKETLSGAKLYFDAVNARGGIAGQKIELISMDDKYDPQVAAANAKEMITKGKVIALFLNRGTAQTEAVLPILATYRVPLIAPSTGAMVFHKPVNRYVFNVRSAYQAEAEKAVRHLAGTGVSRFALVQVDSSLGADGAAGVMRQLDKLKIKPVFAEKVSHTNPEFDALAKKIVATDPQAIIYIGTPDFVSGGMRAVRAAGSVAQQVTLSNNAGREFVSLLGNRAAGTIVTQVFPNERMQSIPMVKELHDLAVDNGLKEVTPAMMEGFAAAKVLVEGLKRAGKSPSAESLTAGLEAMKEVDIGGMKVTYSNDDHTGLEFVDISVISQDGRYLR
jgi:ABC-type branched-subunit amino acid transport system substrate-binding protein